MREIELLDVFPASEGAICQYYGRIGSGKTYAATSDILDLLRRGKVVYANWKIKYDGYDERKSLPHLLLSIFFPWKKIFYFFPKENLKYFEFSDKWAQDNGYKDFMEWFSSITDAYIFGDEGHVMFDSYAGIKMSIEKRAAILHTRHFNRSINIISQRPTAIHVSMRANVNVFYRCQCLFKLGSIVRFKRTEFQDLGAGESVDEDPEKVIDTKYYWGSKRVFNAYDTKYLRGETKPSQVTLLHAYNVGFFSKIRLLGRYFTGNIKKDSKESVFEPKNSDEVIHKLSTIPKNVNRKPFPGKSLNGII